MSRFLLLGLLGLAVFASACLPARETGRTQSVEAEARKNVTEPETAALAEFKPFPEVDLVEQFESLCIETNGRFDEVLAIVSAKGGKELSEAERGVYIDGRMPANVRAFEVEAAGSKMVVLIESASSPPDLLPLLISGEAKWGDPPLPNDVLPASHESVQAGGPRGGRSCRVYARVTDAAHLRLRFEKSLNDAGGAAFLGTSAPKFGVAQAAAPTTALYWKLDPDRLGTLVVSRIAIADFQIDIGLKQRVQLDEPAQWHSFR
jgi:hypothetical protein